MITYDFHNYVVLITGGTGVLGSTFVDAYLKHHAKVVVLGRNKTLLDHMKQTALYPENLLCIEADVLDKKSLEMAKQEVISVFGKLDIILNGVGGNHPSATTKQEYYQSSEEGAMAHFFDLDIKGFQSVFDVNFLAPILTSQVFGDLLLKSERASIITITSLSADLPLTKVPAYSSAKAALKNFTQWLSVHLSKTPIRVNAIAPGFFKTKQNEALLFHEDGSFTQRGLKVISKTPMERFGTPEELLGALFFLSSYEASSFITGTTLYVDGGYSAYSGV